MDYHKKNWSPAFKVRSYQPQHLALNLEIELSPASSHHLVTVMRHKIGDQVAVFNGKDGEWLAEIIKINKKIVICKLNTQLRPQIPCTGVTLLFAPIKPHRQAFLIEKATELGVATLMPIISQYSQIRTFNYDKAGSQAIEAAEQSERLTVPVIEPLVPIEQKLSAWNASQPLLVGVTRKQAPLLSDMQHQFVHHPLSLLIGPEGGFSEQELQYFTKYSFVHKFSLGSNILRAETAALVCLAQNITMNDNF